MCVGVVCGQHFGYFFCKREPGKVTIRIDGVKTEMTVLHVLEFTRWEAGRQAGGHAALVCNRGSGHPCGAISVRLTPCDADVVVGGGGVQ